MDSIGLTPPSSGLLQYVVDGLAHGKQRKKSIVAELKPDEGPTALLMADFRTDGMGENSIARERQMFERAEQVCGLISKTSRTYFELQYLRMRVIN